MSTVIDERVVEMRFDNKQFESGVATTMSTLDKFKKSLDLSGASKGLSNIASETSKTSKSFEELEFTSYKAGFQLKDILYKSFSTMEWRAARNLVDSLTSSVKNLANSILGLPSIKAGFSEYETQMGAIQTILANTQSKGTTLDDVNGALDELNAYADKTIYNFTEMTRNIGTFTAAGVDLDTSVSAIKGIANLAAVSGSTSQQASTAMYQLSQAMASGTVKLMDWNSVVNAGMGGQVFQDALKETAKVHGIAIDDIIKKNGSFRDSLSDGWLSTEILTETLAKFTGDLSEEQLKSMGYTEKQVEEIMKLGQTANDAATKVKTFTQLIDTLKEAAQSGWAQTWEILVGDFEEAKELFSSVSDVLSEMIGKSAESRNEMLSNWKALGGRQDVIDSFKNVFEGLLSIIKPIKEAFSEMFPPLTAEKLKAFTEGLKNLTEKLKLSHDTSDNLKRTFKGVFAVLKIGVNILKAVFKGVGALFGVAGDASGVLLDITASIGDILVKVSDFVEESNIFGKAFEFIADVIKGVGKAFVSFYDLIKHGFDFPGLDFFSSFLDGIREKMGGVGDIAGEMKDRVSKAVSAIGDAFENWSFLKMVQTIWDTLVKFGNTIAKIFGNLVGNVFNKIGNADFGGLFEIINGFIAGGVGVGIIKLVKSFRSLFDNLGDFKGMFDDIIESVTGVVEEVGKTFKSFQNMLNATALKTIATAILMLAAALVVIALIPKEELYDALTAIGILFAGLITSLAMLSKFVGAGGTGKMAAGILGISVGVLILVTALKSLARMEISDMATGLVGVLGLMTVLVGALKVLSSDSQKHIVKGAISMLALAFAVKILAGVCKDLSKLSLADIGKGVLGVFGLMTSIVLVLESLKGKKGKSLMSYAVMLLSLGVAVKILAGAMKTFAGMSWEELGKAGVALYGLVGALALFALISKLITPAKMRSMSSSLLVIGAALLLITVPLKILAGMSWEELGKGGAAIYGLAGALTLFALAAKLITPSKMIKMASSMLILASALVIIAGVLYAISLIPWTGLAKGGVAIYGLAGAIAVFALASKLFDIKTILKLASSMTILGAALIILTAPLMALSLVPSWGLIKAGIAIYGLVGALTLFALASKLFNMGDILKLASAMTILGAALLILTPPVLALSLMSWDGLAKAGAAIYGLIGAFTLLVLASKMLTISDIFGLVNAVSVLSTAMMAVATAFVLFNMVKPEAVAYGLIALAGAFTIMGVAAAILKPLSGTILMLAFSLLKISAAMITISASVVLFGIGIAAIGVGFGVLASGIIALGPAIVGLASSIIASLGIILAGIGVLAAGLVKAISVFIQSICQAIADCAPAIGEAGIAIVLTLCDILVECVPAIVETILVIIEKLLESCAKLIPSICDSLFKIIVGVLESLAQYIPAIIDVLVQLVVNVIDSLASNVGSIIQSIVNLIMAIFQGVIDALGSIDIGVLLQGLMGIGLIAALAAALSAMTALIPGAMLGVLGLGAVILELGLVLAAIGALAQIPGLQWLISEGGNFLQTVGTAIGQFVGGIIGGIAEGATSTLPQIGSNLSDFMTNLQPFVEGAKLIDASVMDGVTTIAGVILALTAANILDGIATFITGSSSITKFAEELPILGDGLTKFSNSVAGINPESVTAAANAAKTLADMTNAIPNSGGVVSWFAGENSISKFANELPILGNGIKKFSDAVSGINPESVTAAANAAKTLAEMTNSIPNAGGVAAWFAGENSISKFATDIVELGGGLKSFSESVAGISTENITSAANAAKTLAEMTNSIPNSGGVVAWFSGENSISKFGSELPVLGAGLKGFSEAVTGIVPENIVAAANAAKALAEMTAVIPTEGGIKAWFTGESSISKFASKLPTLGEGLKGFSSSVAGINPENVKAAATAAKSLGQMAQTVPGDTSKIITFGENLKKFGSSLNTYFTNTKGITEGSISTSKSAISAVKEAASVDSGKIKSAATAIDDVADALKNLAKVPGNAATEFENAMKKLGENSAEKLVDSFKNLPSDMKKIAKEAMESFVDGLSKALSSAKKACKTIATGCKDALREKYQSFYDAGSYLVTGFANGISENDYKAEAKARAMAKAAAQAAEDELGIQSPSKVGYSIGGYFGMGFVNAVDDYASISYKSGVGMADSAKKGLSNAISKINDYINGDIDMQPTIRPVLDLSDIKSGAGAISGMLGMGSSVGVLANVGAISSAMNKQNQNGVNDKLASEISKLNKSLNGMEHATYNINGISFTEGSDVEEAFKTILRAARIERRV